MLEIHRDEFGLAKGRIVDPELEIARVIASEVMKSAAIFGSPAYDDRTIYNFWKSFSETIFPLAEKIKLQMDEPVHQNTRNIVKV